MRISVLLVVGMLLLIDFCVCGANLKLKNGRIYKNYQVYSIEKEYLLVYYDHADGSKKLVSVPVKLLPDNLQKKYFNISQKSTQIRQSEKVVRNIAERMKRDLSKLPADDLQMRRALAGRISRELQMQLNGCGEKAEFSVVATDQKGVYAKVVGTGEKGELNSGEVIYIYGYKPQYSVFSRKVYPAGCKMQSGSYGRIAVYGDSIEDACKMSQDHIGNLLGDATLFLSEDDIRALQSESVPGAQGPAGQPTVVNNYYITEDGNGGYYDGRERVVVIDRGGGGRRPPHNPSQKPPHRPGRNDKIYGSLANPPVSKRRPPWRRPTIQRNEGHSGRYGVLPEKYAPGPVRQNNRPQPPIR